MRDATGDHKLKQNDGTYYGVQTFTQTPKQRTILLVEIGDKGNDVVY